MTLVELYADEERAWSPELDFGVDWFDEPEPFQHRTRVAYIFATGELYTLELRHGGAARIVGTFPVERCRSCSGAGSGCDRCVSTGWSRDRVELVLEGWEQRCGRPGGLRWLHRRLAGWQVQAA